MKKLFIYYSLTNNGDIIADNLKEKGYEIRKVIPKCKYPKNRFFQILIGGYKSSFNKKDKLIDFDPNIDDYDEVIIGSPIWNDRLSPPINSVLDLIDLKDKNISFVLYSASGKADKAKAKIKNLFGIEATVLKEPKKHPEELDKIKGKGE